MTAEQIRAALYDRVLRRVAEGSGVSERTLKNIVAQRHKPQPGTLEKLTKYLGAKP